MGLFIQIEFDAERIEPETARRIVSLCPVDIFALAGSRLVLQPEQEDECTLCELCLEAAPAGSLIIRKNYKDEPIVARGQSA